MPRAVLPPNMYVSYRFSGKLTGWIEYFVDSTATVNVYAVDAAGLRQFKAGSQEFDCYDASPGKKKHEGRFKPRNAADWFLIVQNNSRSVEAYIQYEVFS